MQSKVSITVGIRELCMTGGHRIEIPVPGVTAIVGPNNAGKSTLLREILQELNGGRSRGRLLVRGQSLSTSGSSEDLATWFQQHHHLREQSGRREERFLHFDLHEDGEEAAVARRELDHLWNTLSSDATRGALGQLASFFVYDARWQNRRSMVNPTEARDHAGSPASHPLHLMQDDHSLTTRVSALCEEVFGHPLTLDPTSKRLELRVGHVEMQAPRLTESQAQYRQALSALPRLSDQGDGMTSFMGMIIPLMTASHRIVVIDEPEAFLHPPQAVALGKALSSLAKEKRTQIILATHDRNLLAGLLWGNDVETSVVRLHRVDDVTTPFHLDAPSIRELWTDPLLRYTSLLDGLFHKLVVVAEGERDCRFYQAAIDAAHENSPLPIAPSDILFLPANGKAGMRRVVRSLSAVRVPVVASPDLDILSDKNVLSQLVGELAGDWDSVEDSYRIATDPFRQPRDAAKNRQVLTAVQSILEKDPDGSYGPILRGDVMAALRSYESPWEALKRYGDRAFTGLAREAFERLVSALEEIGIVPVRVGELERFATNVNRAKGAGWLAEALDADVHKSRDAEEHVRRVVAAGARQASLQGERGTT